MKKKKVIAVFCVFLLVVPLILVACTQQRQNVLKVYNWEDYMADGVGQRFEEYYKSQTGKTIKVEFSSFSTNEEAYSQIKTKKEDYDIFVPSDYMIDKMRKEELLLPIDKSIIFEDSDEYEIYDANIVDTIKSSYDPKFEYSIPYLWGTVGILYDPTRGNINVTEEDASSWQSVFSDKFKGKIYMKDSVHDAFSIGSIYADFYDEKGSTLLPLIDVQGDDWIYTDEYYTQLLNVINDTSTSNIERVRQVLLQQKGNLLKYEGDDGKDAMATGGEQAGLLGLYWSTDAGYAMNDNSNLRYTVPKEGSNIYIDGFVIPKYAKNRQAANYFLKFMNDPDIAFDNMDYSGAPSPVVEAADSYRDYLENESDLFEDADDDFKQNYIDMFFANDDILRSTVAFKDFGEQSKAINEMWIGVKAGKQDDDRINPIVFNSIFIVVVVGIVCAVFIPKIKNKKKKKLNSVRAF